VLRYVPEDEDWVASAKDTPLASKDVFYSDEGGKAEFGFPNGTMVRLGGATQVEVSNLARDVTDLYVESGQVRLHNRSRDTYMRASTPVGYLVVPPGARADVYVGDESAEMISLGGRCQFMHTRDGFESKYEVPPGSSLVADKEGVGSGDGTVDADWERWNATRDGEIRGRPQARAAQYLPEPLRDDAPVLEENGRWERVYYEGSYHQMWRPTVTVGWTPFSVGRWTYWRGDHVWVPYEPFGYVTHHYGNWVMVGGGWYWMPPVASVQVGAAPFVPYWYPGRVSWVYSADTIGWVPLAPHEPYYAHYTWGPGVTLVTAAAVAAVTIGTLAYLDHAVVVGHRHFYGGHHHHHGYRGVMVKNVNKTMIVNNYSGARVVDKTVLRNADVKNRSRFVDRDVAVRPHQSVTAQIKERQGKTKGVTASALAADVQKAQAGRLVEGRKVKEPKLTNKMVSASEAGRPQAQFREGKPKAKAEKPKLVAVEAEKGPGKALDRKKGPRERPSGWEKGRKEGWESDRPPGLDQQTSKPGKPEKSRKAGKLEGTDKPPRAGGADKPGQLERADKPGKSGRAVEQENKGKAQRRERLEQSGPKGGQQLERTPRERRHRERDPQGETQRKGKAKQKGEREIE
jgi:hypothetical protein